MNVDHIPTSYMPHHLAGLVDENEAWLEKSLSQREWLYSKSSDNAWRLAH